MDLIMILIVFIILLVLIKLIKFSFKIISKIFAILTIVSLIFTFFIYLDFKDLQTNFNNSTKAFVLCNYNSLKPIAGIKFKNLSKIDIKDKDVFIDVNSLRFQGICSRNQKSVLRRLHDKYYLIFLFNESIINNGSFINDYYLTQDEIKQVLNSDTPKQELKKIFLKKELKKAIDNDKINEDNYNEIKDQIEKSIDEQINSYFKEDKDLKGFFFTFILSYQIRSPLTLFKLYQRNVLKIYPEKITFKMIKLIPESFVEKLVNKVDNIKEDKDKIKDNIKNKYKNN